MGKIGKVQQVSIKDLHPYENNAKIHTDEQIEKLSKSIEEFGFISPCLVDEYGNLIAGHGRMMAAKKLGMTKIPCVYVEGLTETQRKAYILADNRLTELGDWDNIIVSSELAKLDMDGFDIDMLGFDLGDYEQNDWFTNRERFDTSCEEGNEEYNDFISKFDQPKTTDDCYTPDNIYQVVADFVAEKTGTSKDKFIRPFYPGGDYRTESYPAGSIVVDNPPFSILAEIVDFYIERSIPFFLFVPGLTSIAYTSRPSVTYVCVHSDIVYENKAKVLTDFITNCIYKDYAAVTEAELRERILSANRENLGADKIDRVNYKYPIELVTGAMLGHIAVYGQTFKIKREDAQFVRTLDALKEIDKGVYGGGLLISRKAAAERAKIEEAASNVCEPLVIELSEREWQIVDSLGGKN